MSRGNSSRVFAVSMGILIELGGMTHGLFETLQGHKPTEGLVLEKIGAFTLLPNYLLTGFAAILVGSSIICWSIGFIHNKSGPTIFLSLSVILFLVGGGFAQVLFFLINWGVSTRVNKPLTWWAKVLRISSRNLLAKYWVAFLISGFSFSFVGILIWLILLPPGSAQKVSFTDYTCWSFLGTGFVLQMLTIISGFARDIKSPKEQDNFRADSIIE